MEHVLIVDDDIHIGNILEEVLLKEDYQSMRAYYSDYTLKIVIQLNQ